MQWAFVVFGVWNDESVDLSQAQISHTKKYYFACSPKLYIWATVHDCFFLFFRLHYSSSSRLGVRQMSYGCTFIRSCYTYIPNLFVCLSMLIRYSYLTRYFIILFNKQAVIDIYYFSISLSSDNMSCSFL